MIGWQTGDQRQLFYLFNLERRIPASHLLRRINPIVMQVLADLREKLAPFYSDIGRPSMDQELRIEPGATQPPRTAAARSGCRSKYSRSGPCVAAKAATHVREGSKLRRTRITHLLSAVP